MRLVISHLLLTTGMLAADTADVPKKAPLMRYSGLWTDSPFTTKPPPPQALAEVNPFDGYVLGGVSPIHGGYRVTLLNRKKPDERVTVDSGQTTGDFRIVSVTPKPGEPLGTVVRISTPNGDKKGDVIFDPALLILKVKIAQAPGIPGGPAGINVGGVPNGNNPVPTNQTAAIAAQQRAQQQLMEQQRAAALQQQRNQPGQPNGIQPRVPVHR